ncbi:Plasma membrane permease, mediates uptake of glycerophosphoinositol and glycerophosphocholine [Apophysomyces ossiformis]|uniref:Plasma membrane permease, mediates uptake of glycerophosphoinositol and glycerophosphocholine n=1 Tax=Apophysomyces ossiformis TaxID=679940 RepID=A0A8H7BSD6_9FUNG|nr:Plasma membrane permease, mediates uptake of glycerophosphoinositol and glycerophosphocholine [Apophysomyces ossiformis]
MGSYNSSSPSSNSKFAVYEADVDHIICKTVDEQASSSTSASIQTTPKRKTSASIFNVIFSGFALLSDGYQSGVITFVNLFLKHIYGTDILDEAMLSRLSYAMFVGAVVGQLGFGLIIDRIGRKIGLIATTALVIIGAALSCASNGTTPTGLLWMMVIARGVIGVGVGGEYPCSSVSAGESADEFAPAKRGTIFIFVTNFVIDVGYVVSALVPVILLAIFKDNLEPVWRLCLGLGILPPLSVLYFRLKMADSKAYAAGAIKRKVPYLLIIKRYWPRVLITSGLWFVYDFIAYPNGVFSSIIISTVAKDEALIIIVAWNILLYSFYLPGSIGGALSVDKIGRRKTLTFGLITQGVIGMIIGGVYFLVTERCFPMFIIMYGLFLAMGEFAGDCMGLNAMELFPTAVRGTCYGIASAFGKVGATVGTLAFVPMQHTMGGVRGPFLVGSGIAIVAGIIAWLFLPDIGPEGLMEEDEAFKAYLAKNGYDVSQMGHATPAAPSSSE